MSKTTLPQSDKAELTAKARHARRKWITIDKAVAALDRDGWYDQRYIDRESGRLTRRVLTAYGKAAREYVIAAVTAAPVRDPDAPCDYCGRPVGEGRHHCCKACGVRSGLETQDD